MRRASFYVRLSEGLDVAANADGHALVAALLAAPHPALTDIYPAYTTVWIELDLDRGRRDEVEAWVRGALATLERGSEPAGARRLVEIPVRYDGPDLAEAAAAAGLDAASVAALHAAPTYRTFCVGASPGFPFLASVDPRLRLPRRPSPRAAVPAHTVAVTGEQTGIYSVRGPGGWNLLGTALAAVYDPARDEPFLVAPGDDVRFVQADGPTPADPAARPLLAAEPERPALRVEEPGLHDLVVDAGRFRAARFGMATSGPLDARAARLANRLVGNPPDDAVVELGVRGPTLVALRPLVLAVAGAAVELRVNGEERPTDATVAVRRGDVVRLPHGGRGARAYLALAGGIASDAFLGSASTDVRGLVGRPLAAGDVLGSAREALPVARLAVRASHDPLGAPIRLLPGPQATPEALHRLDGARLRVATGDRTGVRLAGAALEGGELVSESPPLGALQVTSGGDPFVLLHDRYRIAGYAKPAVVHPDDLWRLGQVQAGMEVELRVEPARAPWTIRV